MVGEELELLMPYSQVVAPEAVAVMFVIVGEEE